MRSYWLRIDRALGRLRQRLEAATDVDEALLPLFRIFAGLHLLLSAPLSYQWIAEAPQGFFRPPLSLAIYFTDFPSAAFFAVAEWLTVLCSFAILLGIKTRWAAYLLVITSVSALSFKYSFGKIDHGFLSHLTILLLAHTNWSTNLAILPDKPVSQSMGRTALNLIGLSVCFGFFTAGFEKVFKWIDFDMSQGGFIAWWQMCYFTNDRTDLLAEYVPNLPVIVLESFDYIAVAFELSPLVFLSLGARCWRFWLLLAGCFHLGNTLFLNIPFQGMVLVYGVYVFPNFILKAHLYLQSTTIGRLNRWFKFSILGIIGLLALMFDNTDSLYFAVCVWTAYIAAAVIAIMNFRKFTL